MNLIIIIGNRFKEFQRHNGIKTIDEFKSLILKNNLEMLPIKTKLVIGQGVRDAEIKQITDMIAASNHIQRFDLSEINKRAVRAGRIHTHKHIQQNAIISYPHKCNEDTYTAQLMIDDRCELMCDHQTGQHIQGMLIIEAARQTFLTITEEFFIGPDDHRKYYFIINRMDVKFLAFLFPINVTIKYKINTKNIENRDRMQFDANISFIQNEKCASEVIVHFTAYLQHRIKEKEEMLAKEAVIKLQKLITGSCENITSNAA